MSVKIEGGYRKADWKDVLLVQLFYSPYYIYLWIKKYYRRNISKVVSSLNQILSDFKVI